MIRFAKDGSVGAESNMETTTYQISEDNGQTWSNAQALTNLKLEIKNSDGSKSGVELEFTDNEFKEGDTFMVQVAMGSYQGDNGKIAFNTNIHSKIETNINGQEIFEESGFFDSVYKLKMHSYLATLMRLPNLLKSSIQCIQIFNQKLPRQVLISIDLKSHTIT